MKFYIVDERNGRTFDRLAKRQNGHSFVRFYSPHCHWCQKMHNNWQELKNHDKLKDLDVNIFDVHIDALDDISLPCVDDVRNKGVPQMLLLNKNGETLSKYDGSRETDDMAEFVLNNIKDTIDDKYRYSGGRIIKKNKSLKRNNKRSYKRRSIKNKKQRKSRSRARRN
jgi:thioredoxin-related protein